MKSKISWWFNSIPFRKKTALLLTLVLAVSMLVFSVVIEHYVADLLIDRTVVQLDNTLFKMEDNLSQMTAEIELLSEELQANEQIAAYISAEFSNPEESKILSDELRTALSPVLKANGSISSIYIIRPNAVSLRVGDVFDFSWAAIHLTSYYRMADERRQGFWLYDQSLTYHLTTQNEKVISYIQPYISENGEIQALQFINVKAQKLSGTLEPKDDALQSSFAVISMDGSNIAFTSNSFLTVFTARLPYVDKVLQGYTGFRFGLENREYLVDAVYSETCKWYVLGFTDMDYIYGPLKKLNLMFILSAAILIAAAALTSIVLANIECRTLTELSRKMDGIKHGDVYEHAEIRGMDEANTLSIHFNEMVDRLENMIDQLAAEKNLKMKTELNALQEQINPHFLYNLLETINYRAKQSGDDELNRTIIALADFLRLSVNKGKNYMRLEQELSCVKNYVYLQSMRGIATFQVDYEIEPGTEQAMVLKLCIQPLVENAIIHGFQSGRKDCQIHICVRRLGDELYIQVRDNGSGIHQQRLDQINRILQSGRYPSMNVYGIYNVNRRIKLYYGERFGLHLESEEGCYTCATLRMQYLEEVDDGEA